jgi:hypothetical protein
MTRISERMRGTVRNAPLRCQPWFVTPVLIRAIRANPWLGFFFRDLIDRLKEL